MRFIRMQLTIKRA